MEKCVPNHLNPTLALMFMMKDFFNFNLASKGSSQMIR